MKTFQYIRTGLLAFVITTSLALPYNGQGTTPKETPAAYRMVEFPSENAILRGRLYTPEGRSGRWPIVIMAHGYSATIDGMVADRYAERIHQAGYAVLLYDHRNFGISGGEPRQQINIWTQARGYGDAINYVIGLPEIDPDRIAIWGDSMTGGEVIVVAAIDHRVKAIIAQIPSCGDDPIREDPDGKLFESIRDTYLHGDIEGTPENTIGPIAVVSYSPELVPSIMKPSTAFRWFIEYGGRYGTGWKNQVTQVNPDVPVWLDPGLSVRHVKAPLLMIVAYDDEMPYCSSEVAQQVYELAPGTKQLHQIDGGHFGLLHYPSALFDEASKAQVDFLKKHFN